MAQIPILFILGPSGAGKTTLGDQLAQHGVLHINFDRPDCNGVDRERLRKEWNAFLDDRNPQPLADAIRQRMQSSGAKGASITCPSGIVPSTAAGANGCELSRAYLSQMRTVGFHTIILHGTRDDCLAAFQCREAGTGRGLGQDWWDANNAYWQYMFQPTDFAGEVLSAFSSGQHRPLAELVAQIQTKLGM